MDGIGRAALPGERNQVGGKTCDGTKLAEPSWQNHADGTRRQIGRAASLKAVTACGS